MGRMYHRRLLRGAGESQRVFLASPVYDGLGAGFTFAYFETAAALAKAGIGAEPAILAGDCHVDDARNRLVRDFLLSDCTDLVFLDSDLRWDAEDLISLLRHDENIVAATYPVREGDERYPIRMLDATAQADSGGLIEVEGVPTGFLRIRRNVLEALASKAVSYRCKTDRRGYIPLIFERTIVNGDRWGGDYNFCRKARALGERVMLDPEIYLEHYGKDFRCGSFGAWLRDANDTTLSDALSRIRLGRERPATFLELVRFWDNPWSVGPETLAICASLARQAQGPILEAGSGLTTLVMAAANPEVTVYCLEHDLGWITKIKALALETGVTNIAIVSCALEDRWYKVGDELPEYFALGLNDGPPRDLGNRVGFFDHGWADRCEIVVCDDADNPTYMADLRIWAASKGWKVDFSGERAALIRRQERKAA